MGPAAVPDLVDVRAEGHDSEWSSALPVAIPACPVHFGGGRTRNRRSAGHGLGRPCRLRAYGCATASGAPMPIRAPWTWMGVTPVLGIPRPASGRMEPDIPILPAAAGSLPASDPVREGQSANRDGHVGSIAQAVARAGGTTLASGGERVLRRFGAAPADPSQQGTIWTPIRVSGWTVGVVAYSGTLLEPYDSTASVQHRIKLRSLDGQVYTLMGAGLRRERQRNHRASLRAEDTRPRSRRH